MDGIGRIILSRATELRAVEGITKALHAMSKKLPKLDSVESLVEPMKFYCLINTAVY